MSISKHDIELYFLEVAQESEEISERLFILHNALLDDTITFEFIIQEKQRIDAQMATIHEKTQDLFKSVSGGA